MRLHHLAILGFFVVGAIIGAAMVSIGYQSHEPRALPAPKISAVEHEQRTVDEQLGHLRELQMARLRALQNTTTSTAGGADDKTVSEVPSTWREAGGQALDTPATVARDPGNVELVTMPNDYSPADPAAEELMSDAWTATEPDCETINADVSTSPVPAPDADLPTVDDLVADSTSDMERKILEIAMEKASEKVEDLPSYELLHANKDFKSDKVYAELLIPSLKSAAGHAVKQRIVDAIAKREGLDVVTVYCTPEARKAHYSMEYYDDHPEVLDEGYVGEYEKGRLWLYVSEK